MNNYSINIYNHNKCIVYIRKLLIILTLTLLFIAIIIIVTTMGIQKYNYAEQWRNY